MKKVLLPLIVGLTMVSCNQVEEKINNSINTATETVKQKAQQKVKETIDKTIDETVNSVTNAENIPFETVFPGANTQLITEYKGKKIKLPNGSFAYLLKYKADKELLISELEKQPTENENQSDVKAKKIDGQSFIDKLSFVEKFIPEGTIDTSFIDEIKSDKSMQFYRLKRWPNKSTIIVNPKTNAVYQFVEISK